MTAPGPVAHLHTNRAWGGGEDQVLALLKALPERGAPAVLYTPEDGMLHGRAQAAGVAVRPLAACRAAALRTERVRLVHAHDSRALTLGGRLAPACGVPLVLSRRVASPLRRNPWSRRKYGPDRVAAVIAISETVRRVMAQSGYPRERIFVAPSGLDVAALDRVEADAAWRPADGAGRLVAGVGRLSRKKNWAMLVRVAARLEAAGEAVQWVVAGEGPERRRLERLIRKLGVAHRVRLAGFRNDARSLLKTADLLFFPSLIEGASVTVREAMILGTPVVAVDAPGTAESLGGCGRLVRAGDTAGAAEAVAALLRDEAGRAALARRAREQAASRFSLTRTVTETLAAY
ncbi:MAG: glycosyltransferase, partial [Lentisphaerae bacterium]|nr:glycosyltransferase [Lentisphaerota bacterium]